MNKQTITFTASEQTLTKTGGIEHYASNIVSYIEASFTLGDNWAGYDSIRAVWESGYARIATVLDANNKCIVPAEVLNYKSKVNVNLVGSIVENTVLTDRLTTYPILALTVDADARVDSSETTPVTATQFEQFVDVVRDEASAIQNYTYDSEAWAVGQRAGVDVPSTDETYHNNAKYYADQGATLQQEVTDLKSDIDGRISGFNFSANGNLYNTQALVENKYIDPSSGKIVSSTHTGFAYSKTYINVTSGETLCSNTRMFIAYYDSNLKIVSALQMDSTKKTVVPSGVVFARFSASVPDQSAVVVQRGESLNNDKSDYTFSLDGLNINPFSLGAQQYKDLMNYEQGDNLYNVHAIVKQRYIDPTSGKILSASSDTWAYSTTYIPVSSGDVLTATDRMIIAYYDDEYNVISALQMDATKQTTVPANASFARFSISVNDHSAVKVVKGTSISSSVGTYSFKLKGLTVGDGAIVVDVSGSGDYTSFTEAVYENVDDGRDIIVKAGTYDIKAEYIALFGQSVVDNLADSTSGMNDFQYGVRIHDRKVTFESGSHLVCDWTGHTVDGTHRFCPLRVEPNAHIVGLDLDCTATFYGIHDDYGTADNSPFTIKYENCRVIGHNLYNANCIGGGAHKYSRHILNNCYFKNNVSSSDRVLSADVRYHNTNTADAEPELYVSNCYFSNNMNITYYGTQTTKFRAYVNNCFAPYGIIKRGESASMTTDNVELYTWNNQIN